MPRVGFEPTIPVFVKAKTVHALERAATVIGNYALYSPPMSFSSSVTFPFHLFFYYYFVYFLLNRRVMKEKRNLQVITMSV
jgi:hypothetical protein